jgi:hypothetical protein
MGLFTRYKGVHRAVLSGKAKIAAVVTVGLLGVGGGAVAIGAADASPWNPNVTVVGVVDVCHGGTPRTVNFAGSSGDRGSIPVAPDRGYAISLRHVPGGRGEWIGGTVDCAGPGRSHYIRRVPFRAFDVQRPWRGGTVRHTI